MSLYVHTYNAEFDLALTHALRNPRLAARCLTTALNAAIRAGRPDLAAEANELLGIVGG